jgi:hypothetical protein
MTFDGSTLRILLRKLDALAVAAQFTFLFDAISVEMVFREMYHFTQAWHRGDGHDPVMYLAEHARVLAVLKRKRKHSGPAPVSDGP